MEHLDFIKKLYNGKNCYSDFMTKEQLDILRIESNVDNLIDKFIKMKKMIFLTGNPGDGKTYIIKSHYESINDNDVYVNTDINSLGTEKLSEFADKLIKIYNCGYACLIAANEFPFLQLQKILKIKCKNLYDELNECKKHNIVFENDVPYTCKRCVVIDLNERNLLYTQQDAKRGLSNLFKKTIKYLNSEKIILNSILKNNIMHLSDINVQSKIINLLNYVAFSGEHYVVRDILGFTSYLFVSSIINEDDKMYYDAIFECESDNNILIKLKKFDPILVTKPSLDEQLWNGEISNGWLFGKPSHYPFECDDTNDALQLFKSIKRRYYFENTNATSENFIDEIYRTIIKMFKHPEKIENIEKIILAMNSMYLCNETEQNNLLIWNTNRYDVSIPYKAAVCTKQIYKDKFELLAPDRDKWLENYEFVPSYLLFRIKKHHDIFLKLDINFLTILLKISHGYPVNLVDSHYEQLINGFMRKIENTSDCTNADSIIIANRRNNDKLKIKIDDNVIKFIK